MANPLHIYASSHINSKTVCKAFAQGSKAPIVPPAPLRPGEVFMYGCLRGLEATLRQAQAEGRTFYYADNGYLCPGHWGGYFRVTKNAYQIDGQGVSNGARLARLAIHVKPWRVRGKHIVFCPPSDVWCKIIGLDQKVFIAETMDAIKAHTDRLIVVRGKRSTVVLAGDLEDAWCLVTYSSNAAVEAVIAGIPVICLGRCAASPMSGTIEQIEDLPTPARAGWLGVLADNQWTLDEMRDGTCWKQLREQF